MIEIDGPLMAWLEDSAGNKYIYKVYAIGQRGNTAADVIQAYASWRQMFEDTSCILVWRRRPQLVFEQDAVKQHSDGTIVPNPDPKEYWKITCRCVKVPIKVLGPILFELNDGNPIPFMGGEQK